MALGCLDMIKQKHILFDNAVKNEVDALQQKLSDLKVIILVLWFCLALIKNYMVLIILRLN